MKVAQACFFFAIEKWIEIDSIYELTVLVQLLLATEEVHS
jgi:hypothetical protein